MRQAPFLCVEKGEKGESKSEQCLHKNGEETSMSGTCVWSLPFILETVGTPALAKPRNDSHSPSSEDNAAQKVVVFPASLRAGGRLRRLREVPSPTASATFLPAPAACCVAFAFGLGSGASGLQVVGV